MSTSDKKYFNHDYDSILARLTTILSKLNDGEALSVKELSGEFKVSTKTIQRDFNERLTNFPIYQENKKWKMQEGYRIEKITSLEETLILEIIEGFAGESGGAFAKKAKGLISKLKNPSSNPIYTRLDMEDISDKLNDLQTLESTITENKFIACTYTQKQRELKPLKIATYGGLWYLIAIDTDCKKLKKFYIKDITNISIKEATFTIDDKLDTLLENAISIWFDETKKPFEVKLWIASKVAKYFKRKPISKTQQILSRDTDGSIEVSIMITHVMEINPIILHWLPHIEVLEPASIREDIYQTLDNYLEESKSRHAVVL